MSTPNPPALPHPEPRYFEKLLQDLIALLSDPTQYLQQHPEGTVALITGAPLAVLVIIVLTSLGTWAWARARYKNRIEDLESQLRLSESRLRLKEDEITWLKAQLPQGGKGSAAPNEQTTLPQLQFDFPENGFNHSSPNGVTAFVRVKNPASRTIESVSVRVASIMKLDGPEDPDYTRNLKTFVDLPLMIHGDGGRPPFHKPQSHTDIHTGEEKLFDVLLYEPGRNNHPPITWLWHAQWDKLQVEYNREVWSAYPPPDLRPGRYHLQLRAQGKDTPPETLTLEFAHTADEAWARKITK